MAIIITQIEKHRFVSGLFWQSLSRPRELKKEAVDLAKKIDSDLMVIRMDHSTAQAGFAQSNETESSGALYSLAAVISKTLSIEGAYYDGLKQSVHNWLGAFKLPDEKWAYVAVRDANFLPNGDFAGTKEEVLDRLQADYSLGGWNVIIGHEELADLGFHNFNARTIESMLPHRANGRIRMHRWWRLQPVSPKFPLPLVLAGAVIAVALLAGGYKMWQTHLEAKRLREQEEAMEAVRQRLAKEKLIVNRPWASRPTPAAMLKACAENLRWQTAGGWMLDTYTCTPTSLVWEWRRNGSNVAFLRAQVPDVQADLNGEKATYVRPLKLAASANEQLMSVLDVIQPIQARLQAAGMRYKIAPIPVSATGISGNFTPDWRAYGFMMETAGLPPEVLTTWLDRPGLRVEKVSRRKETWIVEGIIYAK